jgi:hypothetical protein
MKESEEGASVFTFEPKKTEKPEVKFFVMSFCPFGNQVENSLYKVYKLLGNKVEWSPHYIVSKDSEGNYRALHGKNELNQNVREICVKKYFGVDKWWEFVYEINNKCSLENVETCWEDIAEKLEIDKEKVKECQKKEMGKLLDKEIELTEKYSATGSPTIFINDERYESREMYLADVIVLNGKNFTARELRTPEALKQAICSAFTSQPKECEEVLTGSVSVKGRCG